MTKFNYLRSKSNISSISSYIIFSPVEYEKTIHLKSDLPFDFFKSVSGSDGWWPESADAIEILEFDFEHSIFIHDYNGSSITMGLNKTLRQHACYCPVDVSVYPVWSKNFYIVKPLNFHSTTSLINKTLCKSEEGFTVNLLCWTKQNQVF